MKRALMDHWRDRELISHNSWAPWDVVSLERGLFTGTKCLSQHIFPQEKQAAVKTGLQPTFTTSSSRLLSDPGLFVQKTKEKSITLEKSCTPLFSLCNYMYMYMYITCTLALA